MNLFKWFQKQEQIFTGALLDTRPPEEKADDIHFNEIVASANLVDWQEKSRWRTFPSYNQHSSNMCGANALSKALGIAYSNTFGAFVPFSRADIYQRRSNKPGVGMGMADMFDIASKGVTLEQLTPKEVWTDADADTMVIESYKHKVGEVFSVSGGVYLPADIDTIASVIQTTGKGVILLTYFSAAEWSAPFPTILDNKITLNNSLHHFVTAVDFGMKNGVKYLRIEDSAWFGGFSERFLDTSWINYRVYAVGYPMNFKFQIGDSNKPIYDGYTIISAQKCLQYEGLFPTNVAFIEHIGPLTRKALLAFQAKNNLVQNGIISSETRNLLLAKYQ